MTEDDEPEVAEDTAELEPSVEKEELPPWEGFRSAFSIRKHKVNVMLFLVPLAGGMALFSNNQTLSFVLSLAAIMPLASLMGRATEEIALRTSQSIGGLLNATFGNSAEIIIALMAIYAASQALALGTTEGDLTAETMIKIVQASLIGSILGNLLLVLGLAFVWGGMKYHVQHFSPDAVGANSSLLLLAVIALIVPTTFAETVSGDAAAAGILKLSRISAFVLLGLYGLFLLFQLRTHQELFAADGQHEDEPSMGVKASIALLLVSTIGVIWMAEILVHSIEVAADSIGLPHLFIGIILLPLFGNAAEHVAAVSVARRDKMDLSFSIAVGSSTQIAVFVAPLVVLASWAMGVPMTFEFGLFETVATFIAVLIANSIAADGKSNWLEGAMLLGTYAILAIAFFFHP